MTKRADKRIGPPAVPGDRAKTTAAERVSAAHPTAGGRCWRCGQPVAWTDLDTLARCYELATATQAVEERAAAGLCPVRSASVERQRSVAGETAGGGPVFRAGAVTP